MNKVIKVLYGIFLTIVILIIVVNLSIVIKSKIRPNEISDFMGYKPFIVLSGSMETNINIGDLVIVKETDYSKLKENDIIAFRHDDVVITHRIIKTYKDNGALSFVTKGDNNNVQDDFMVKESEVEGKYVLKIAGLGSIFMFLSNPLGMLVVMFGVIIISGIIYIFCFKNSNDDKELMREFEEFKKQKLSGN